VSRPLSLRELPKAYFAYAAWPTLVATVGCTVVGWLAADLPGLWGGAVGGAVVVLFFGADLLVMRLSVRWSPVATFGAVITDYLVKIILMALLLAWVRAGSGVDGAVLGVSMGVCAVVFLTGLVVGYTRIPTFSIDPADDASPST
jgi:hypothetical protein